MENKNNVLLYQKLSVGDYDVYRHESDDTIPNIGIIHAKKASVLFYPHPEIFKISINFKQYLQAEESIKYVIVSPSDILNKVVIDQLQFQFPDVVFLSDAQTAKKWLIAHKTLPFKIIENKMLIKLDDEHHLRIISVPFIPFHNAFIVYDEQAKVLISDILFSHLNDPNNLKSFLAYHEQVIPSSDFLRPVMQIVKKLKPEVIIPAFGKAMMKDDVAFAIKQLFDFTFYNSNYIVRKAGKNRRTYNYLNLCNQVLIQLKNIYSAQEVLAIFQNTNIKVDPISLEIMSAPYTNFKLWHYLFDIIYDQKGGAWLAVLEKTVNKLNRLYHINKPTVYKSSLVTSTFENIQLQSQVSSLQERYNQISENLSRCPITKAYNETFLKNYLKNITEQLTNTKSDEDHSLLFVDIDNIRKLNMLYSKEIGDETLRNLYYLLNQLKAEGQTIFKRNGPGFVVLCQDCDYQKSLSLANHIRNNIEMSDSFVEKITVSVAISRLHEFSQGERSDESIADLWFNRGESRIKIAASKGSNLIIDEKSKNISLSVGKIIIIDTDEIIHNVLSVAFKNLNYEVLIAKDGLSALEIIQNEKINMIICEKNIPKLDGFQIKSRLNENIETQTVPFILTTFNKNKEIVTTANSLGIDFILTKPVIVEEVMGLVKRLTSKRVIL